MVGQKRAAAEEEMVRLEELRRRAALSQAELAARADVSPRTIYNIEKAPEAGKPYAPRGKVMRAIAAALGVEPKDVDEFRGPLGLAPSPEG